MAQEDVCGPRPPVTGTGTGVGQHPLAPNTAVEPMNKMCFQNRFTRGRKAASVNNQNHAQSIFDGMIEKIMDTLTGISNPHAVEVDMRLDGKSPAMEATGYVFRYEVSATFNVLRCIGDTVALPGVNQIG